MPEGKIEFSIGDITFVGEGEQNWVAEQLDKILEKAPQLTKSTPKKRASSKNDAPGKESFGGETESSIKPLPSFLREKNAEKSQPVKFLATAIWIHDSKSQRRIKTNDVTTALRNASQKKLSNASECLSKNVKKGFIEKEGREFYVTEEGRRSL